MVKHLALIALLGLSACATSEAPSDRGLSDRIAAEVERGERATVDLAALAPFEWTRLYVFPPYTTEETAENALGFPWPYAWSAVEHDDTRTFLVLVNGEEVVAAFDHSRGHGDFAGLSRTSYSPDSARFVVRKQGLLAGGDPHYVLRPAP
jgi:hypothetical protein